ncbi:MAG TPA: hypothetical protein VGD50_08100, partial [Candidatus Baltobacteraceae bacterium]
MTSVAGVAADVPLSGTAAAQVLRGSVTIGAAPGEAPGDGASLVVLSGRVLDGGQEVVTGDVNVMLT